ncbi:MAG: ribosome silencing factor [Candidatus Poribacteria bacterium]|nr:ribosome silencing factor [Candidatus Poribacteria bacterium]
METNNTLEIVKDAASAAVSRRAQDPVILDLRELDCFTDYFAIFSGISDVQVEGISEAILEELQEKWHQQPWHREGANKADWILLDYVDFVIHIFLNERRSYYNLERLWAEAPHIDLPEMEGIPVMDIQEEYDEDELVLGLVPDDGKGQS